MSTLSDISPGEFTLWLALFIACIVAWYWPDKE